MSTMRSQFGDDFVFGAATAAYQIEGSKFGGCGESIWDHFAKNGGTNDGEDGDVTKLIKTGDHLIVCPDEGKVVFC